MNFIIYHSGYEAGTTEGPYDPANVTRGVDTLIKSVESNNIGRNANVYAELGSTWRYVMRDPTTAAHLIGKLLKHIGEDNVLWGTDAIWYGSPQAQLQAFRAFTISDQFQEQFGYTALTPALKRQVLGLNAAALFRLDADATRCALVSDPIAGARTAAAHLRADGALPAASRANGPTTRREMLQWLASPATHWTPA